MRHHLITALTLFVLMTKGCTTETERLHPGCYKDSSDLTEMIMNGECKMEMVGIDTYFFALDEDGTWRKIVKCK